MQQLATRSGHGLQAIRPRVQEVRQLAYRAASDIRTLGREGVVGTVCSPDSGCTKEPQVGRRVG